MATAITIQDARRDQLWPALLVISMVLYVVAVLLPLAGLHLPLPYIVGPQVLAPSLFALIHGSRVYGWRGILIFTAICFVVCHIVENIGVVTGFPFGTYYFTDAMGPKLFRVPLTMGLAYVAIGYSCWTLSLLILNGTQNKLRGTNSIAALAACIMVVWDFCSEPAWSTISHFWIWRHGGPYFGIPLSNFAGWFLTDFVIFQVFAFYLVKSGSGITSLPQTYWRLAVLSYIVVISANILSSINLFHLPPVSDPAGIVWNASSIALTSILISVFIMGPLAFLAWSNLSGNSRSYENTQG